KPSPLDPCPEIVTSVSTGSLSMPSLSTTIKRNRCRPGNRMLSTRSRGSVVSNGRCNSSVGISGHHDPFVRRDLTPGHRGRLRTVEGERLPERDLGRHGREHGLWLPVIRAYRDLLLGWDRLHTVLVHHNELEEVIPGVHRGSPLPAHCGGRERCGVDPSRAEGHDKPG